MTTVEIIAATAIAKLIGFDLPPDAANHLRSLPHDWHASVSTYSQEFGAIHTCLFIGRLPDGRRNKFGEPFQWSFMHVHGRKPRFTHQSPEAKYGTFTR